jgi:hypothetical protein
LFARNWWARLRFVHPTDFNPPIYAEWRIKGNPRYGTGRHCERSEAIHAPTQRKNGLLRRKCSSQ